MPQMSAKELISSCDGHSAVAVSSVMIKVNVSSVDDMETWPAIGFPEISCLSGVIIVNISDTAVAMRTRRLVIWRRMLASEG